MGFGGARRHRVWFAAAAVGLVAPLIWAPSTGAAGRQMKEPKYGFTFALPNNWRWCR
jgi:hypothetical protein